MAVDTLLTVPLEISLKGQRQRIDVPEGVDLVGLEQLLSEKLGIDAGGFTIIVKGRKLTPQAQPTTSLANAGESYNSTMTAKLICHVLSSIHGSSPSELPGQVR